MKKRSSVDRARARRGQFRGDNDRTGRCARHSSVAPLCSFPIEIKRLVNGVATLSGLPHTAILHGSLQLPSPISDTAYDVDQQKACAIFLCRTGQAMGVQLTTQMRETRWDLRIAQRLTQGLRRGRPDRSGKTAEKDPRT